MTVVNPTTPSRRVILGVALAGGIAAVGMPGPERVDAVGARPPMVEPRATWAKGLASGPLEVEEAVRFLLIHHTETPNDDARDAVAARLRSIHRFHTGEKGWPDVAYNFFVDRYGRIWEGRAGSLAGPVRGDATGGSQGHALLCCFIGDHTTTPPTPAAQEAMASLLAWLASRHGIDLRAGRTITFVSRGSNRWPKGSQVTTTPVAGHRDMSMTACPGDAAYPLVHGAILRRAQRLSGAPAHTTTGGGGVATPRASASASANPGPTESGVTPTASTPSALSPTAVATSMSTTMATPGTAAPSTPPMPTAASAADSERVSPWWGVAGASAMAAGAGLLLRRSRASS